MHIATDRHCISAYVPRDFDVAPKRHGIAFAHPVDDEIASINHRFANGFAFGDDQVAMVDLAALLAVLALEILGDFPDLLARVLARKFFSRLLCRLWWDRSILGDRRKRRRRSGCFAWPERRFLSGLNDPDAALLLQAKVMHLCHRLKRLLSTDVLEVDLGGLIQLAGHHQVNRALRCDLLERFVQRSAKFDRDLPALRRLCSGRSQTEKGVSKQQREREPQVLHEDIFTSEN